MSVRIVREIARRTRVSERTVLRILAGDGPTSRPTVLARAERIRALAASLGYRPNAAARAVTTGRFRCIGLITTAGGRGLTNLPERTYAGLLQGLTPREHALLVTAIPDDIEGQVLPRTLRERFVDGLIISHQGRPGPALEAALARTGLPVMWMNLRRARDCVHPDDLAVGAAATRMLLEMGHRRIAYGDSPLAFAEDDPTNHYSRIDRRRGYEAEMRRAGLEPRALICSGGGEPMQALLAGADRPTAVITYGTGFVQELDWAARAIGLRVPADLSLVSLGLGELEPGCFSGWMVPQLETGRQTAERILRRIEPPSRSLPALALPFVFHPGRSLAPPPR